MQTLAEEGAGRIALESIDDALAVVDGRPVTVESLWGSVLQAVDCGNAESVIAIHPSWWPPSRGNVVAAAAQSLGGEVVVRPRSWLLRRASTAKAVIVEIVDEFAVITGATIVAETRRGDEQAVADAVALTVLRVQSNTGDAVVIDAPRTVRGATVLSALIAQKLRDNGVVTVVEIGDLEFRRLASGVTTRTSHVRVVPSVAAGRRRWRLALAAPLLGGVVGVGALMPRPTPVRDAMPTTVLVEGHVAVEVPSDWPVQRVVAGPGSARLRISSPSDPEVALHVTQSRVALTGLAATAEFLRSAIDAAPTGVFVDFNPAGRDAGRSVVTYREVRSGHDVRWTVWVDKAVRISIGCQNPRDREPTMSRECDRAIRSARAVL